MAFVVVDLEATCWSAVTAPARHAQQAEETEIIEIGAVKLSAGLQPMGEFSRLVRPVRHPTLTDFCCSLTGITQGEVDAADGFARVYGDFLAWIGGPMTFVSWSRFDHEQLLRQSQQEGLPLPPWHPVDAKEEFTDWGRGHTGRKMRFGLKGALEHLGMTVEGTAHRGLDDARNLVRLFQHIRDPAHMSPQGRDVLVLIATRSPRPTHLGHLKARWPEAKRWFPRVRRELLRLGLAEGLGSGRGLRLTPSGEALVTLAGEGL